MNFLFFIAYRVKFVSFLWESLASPWETEGYHPAGLCLEIYVDTKNTLANGVEIAILYGVQGQSYASSTPRRKVPCPDCGNNGSVILTAAVLRCREVKF